MCESHSAARLSGRRVGAEPVLNRLAREHMTTDLRAWIVSKEPLIELFGPATVDGATYERSAAFRIAFVNSGRTPALNVRARFEIRTGGVSADPPKVDFGDSPAGPGSIVDSGEVTATMTKVIGDGQRAEWLEYRLAVFLYLDVRYNTVFDEEERHSRLTYHVCTVGGRSHPEGRPEYIHEAEIVGTGIAT